jgi:hypothetical protein
MDFLRAFIGFAIIFGLAFLLGRLKHHHHPELFTYCWIGSIFVLLVVRFCL